MFTAQERLHDAERILTQALAVTGGGDLKVRERLEDAQLARVQQQVEIANRRAEQEKTEEADRVGQADGRRRRIRSRWRSTRPARPAIRAT